MKSNSRIEKDKKLLIHSDIEKAMESVQDRTEVYRLLYSEKTAPRKIFTSIPRGWAKSVFCDMTLKEVGIEEINNFEFRGENETRS